MSYEPSRDAIKIAHERCTVCAGCGAEQVAAVVLFEPVNPEVFVVAPPRSGATRLVAYGMCRACLDSGMEGQIERSIAADPIDDEPVDVRTVRDGR